MKLRTLVRLGGVVAALLVVATAVSVFTAGNTVPASSAGSESFPIDANALKPPECASLNLSGVVVGGSGGNANELILGSAAADTLGKNGAGDDCILGGGGDDTLWGANASATICIGGPGVDGFHKCGTEYQ